MDANRFDIEQSICDNSPPRQNRTYSLLWRAYCAIYNMRQYAFAQINDTDRDGAWLDFQHGVAGMITPTFDRTGPSDLCSVMNEDSRNSGHT